MEFSLFLLLKNQILLSMNDLKNFDDKCDTKLNVYLENNRYMTYEEAIQEFTK